MERFGLSVAISTPFGPDGSVDVPRLAAHATDLLGRGVQSVTVFGTTGEGASIAASERRAVLEGVIAGGVAPGQIIACVCATASAEARAQIAEAMELGIRDILLTPPFYFKGVEDDAVFDWHREAIGEGPGESRFVVYNIPQLTGVTISPDLLGRLCDAYPGRIRAVKDSSGSRASAEGFLKAGHTQVLVGDERQLGQAVREGAGGAISGMANLHPETMRRLVDHGSDEPALIAEVEAVIAAPVVPSIKALLARDKGAPSWAAVRPPLSSLAGEALDRLLAAADAARAG